MICFYENNERDVSLRTVEEFDQVDSEEFNTYLFFFLFLMSDFTIIRQIPKNELKEGNEQLL